MNWTQLRNWGCLCGIVVSSLLYFVHRQELITSILAGILCSLANILFFAWVKKMQFAEQEFLFCWFSIGTLEAISEYQYKHDVIISILHGIVVGVCFAVGTALVNAIFKPKSNNSK